MLQRGRISWTFKVLAVLASKKEWRWCWWIRLQCVSLTGHVLPFWGYSEASVWEWWAKWWGCCAFNPNISRFWHHHAAFIVILYPSLSIYTSTIHLFAFFFALACEGLWACRTAHRTWEGQWSWKRSHHRLLQGSCVLIQHIRLSSDSISWSLDNRIV